MAKPSSIDKLPAEIRAQLNRLRQEGASIDEVVAYLQSATAAKISRSAVGRHVKKLEEITARIRDARAIAEGVAPTLAEKDDGQLLNLNVELLHSGIMRVLSATEDGEDVPLKPSEAMAIGKALEASSKAQKIGADRVLKIREAVAKSALVEVTKELKKGGQPGLSKELADDIFDRVMRGS